MPSTEPRGPKQIYKAFIWSMKGLRAAWRHEASFRLEGYLFVIFFPFYVFPSGLPQPADCLMVILTPMLFSRWNGRLPKEMVR